MLKKDFLKEREREIKDIVCDERVLCGMSGTVDHGSWENLIGSVCEDS